MITVSDIAFSYHRKEILKSVSFTAAPGEALVIAGPNGSGKSTLLSLLSGTLKPKHGTIDLGNAAIGLVPQGNSIFEDMTVWENIQFFCRLAKVPLPEQLPMGLLPYKDKKAGTLSGGYQKRLAIACAEVSDPDIWLFDEPCSSLDIVWRDEMTRIISNLKQAGKTILYVGHDPAEFLRFYDKILFLQDGTCELMDAQTIEPGTEYRLFREKVAEFSR